jgi:hypothetical protein
MRCTNNLDRILFDGAGREHFDQLILRRFVDMKLHHYDIVRHGDDELAIWLEAASDLNSAECRIQEFASFWPGEFQVVDQQNHQIVARVNGLLKPRRPQRGG